jgi:hypothetical protein
MRPRPNVMPNGQGRKWTWMHHHGMQLTIADTIVIACPTAGRTPIPGHTFGNFPDRTGTTPPLTQPQILLELPTFDEGSIFRFLAWRPLSNHTQWVIAMEGMLWGNGPRQPHPPITTMDPRLSKHRRSVHNNFPMPSPLNPPTPCCVSSLDQTLSLTIVHACEIDKSAWCQHSMSGFPLHCPPGAMWQCASAI